MALQLTAENQNLLQQRFAELPIELSAIFAGDIVQKIGARAREAWGLTETQQTVVENELVLLILGFSLLKDMQALLVKEAGVSLQTADFIVNDFMKQLPEAALLLMKDLENTEKEVPLSSEQDDNTQTQGTSSVQESAPSSIDTPSNPETPTMVPRYAKPLTDLPRYNDNQQ